MSRRYHAHFPPQATARAELFELVAPHLAQAGMRFSGECAALERRPGGELSPFSYEERTFRDAAEAIRQTGDWHGVMLEYDTPLGDRSLTLFTSGEEENVGFDDTAGLYATLIEDPSKLRELESFLVELASRLGAAFALYFFNTPYRRLDESDLADLIAGLPTSRDGARPPLVILRDDLRLPPAADRKLAQCYDAHARAGHRVLRDKQIFDRD